MTKRKRVTGPPPLTEIPCAKCLLLAREKKLRVEAVQRMPAGAMAPLDLTNNPCCYDCASADTVLRTARTVPGFVAARIAVANCRAESLRLPGIPIGLVLTGHVRASQRGDLEAHHAWLEKNAWFGLRVDEDAP